MANWFWELFFPKQEQPLDDALEISVVPPTLTKPKCKQFIVAGHVFRPKQSDEPGKTPTLIAKDELLYNSADDVFFVGLGDDKWKTYRCV